MDYISRLFSFIPDKDLEAFAIDTQVNKYSKKLQGELLFKLLCYCLITGKDNSLNLPNSIMLHEQLYHPFILV